MADILVTIICSTESVELARETAAEFLGGAGMFTTALYAPGNPEPTHYISSGDMPEEIVTALDGLAIISDKPGLECMAELGLVLVSEQ